MRSDNPNDEAGHRILIPLSDVTESASQLNKKVPSCFGLVPGPMQSVADFRRWCAQQHRAEMIKRRCYRFGRLGRWAYRQWQLARARAWRLKFRIRYLLFLRRYFHVEDRN